MALLFSALLLTVPSHAGAYRTRTSEEFASNYFRLKAHYAHAGEPIDFDIIVACNVRVERSPGGDSGFLATRYPRFFVQRTRDNHAVMQIVPGACRGETSENGLVPGDFLPGAIWFRTPGDYRFGIAYFTEDAFESRQSQLTFLGATIEKATRAEWEVFTKRAADNEGMKSRYYNKPYFSTDDAQRITAAAGKEIEAAYARACSGVARYKLSEAGRAIVRKYWPTSKPKFWAAPDQENRAFRELLQVDPKTPVFVNGLRYTDYLNPGNYQYGGFPTRSGGGMLYSNLRKRWPPELFPARDDRGIPWIFTEEVANSNYFARAVEVRTGPGRGFLYCYSNLNRAAGNLEERLPNFRHREVRARVDDETVATPEPTYANWPSPFFETDEYLYVHISIGLS